MAILNHISFSSEMEHVMKKLLYLSALAAGAFACQFTVAQAATQTATQAATQTAAQSGTPTTKPADATGLCKDGTYATSASKSGACRGHKGVKDWYAAPAGTAVTSTAAAPTPASTPAPAGDPASPAPVARTPSPSTQVRTQSQAAAQAAGQSATPPATQSINKGPKANLATAPVAPGGGPGMVWVNTASNVYHCPGTDFYGKTKAGSYMTEADAKAKGARGVRGKSCSK